MRKYILTAREKHIIAEYLENGQQLEGFRLIKSLILKFDMDRVEADLRLIKSLIQRL